MTAADREELADLRRELIAGFQRIEDKLDERLTATEGKTDGIDKRLDRIEGGMGLIRWIGAGLATTLLGLLAHLAGPTLPK